MASKKVDAAAELLGGMLKEIGVAALKGATKETLREVGGRLKRGASTLEKFANKLEDDEKPEEIETELVDDDEERPRRRGRRA